MLDGFEREFALRDLLSEIPALHPIALERDDGGVTLVMEDFHGDPVGRLLGAPMEMEQFLQLAVITTAAVRQMHRAGLVHRDIKPSNILVDSNCERVRLTGFAFASRLVRERQSPEPPEVIAGTLPYMAPEQTGRMNRSVDSRSDLYSLGVMFCEMITGSLPFSANDAMEWVHCHIARRPLIGTDRRRIPAALVSVISKLLAKTAEDRYQTASGLEHDLRLCLQEWRQTGDIQTFSLGQRDIPDRLLIPEKLYGRDREVRRLLAAFERIARHGTTELVMVSGYSGIGKSAIVQELHRAMVPLRGLFAVGKFDQFRRNIPYATVAQAFGGLVRQLLAANDSQLEQWRATMVEALGSNGQLIVDLIPELALIIGDQPAVPDLPPQDAHNRFLLTFRRFLGVFATPDHPLVLFLDDLQWLDMATLELIEHLISTPEISHILLVGAYRDNEVDASHPLSRMLATLRNDGTKFEEIILKALAVTDMTELVADALRAEHGDVRALAESVVQKTGGNPFFAIQFLSGLNEDNLLTFDDETASWVWDLQDIRDQSMTDNVVDLMAARLTRLPEVALEPLMELACLGNTTQARTLALVMDSDEAQIRAALWHVEHLGLITRRDSTYSFLHDRVQEAAYSLIPDGERGAAHLRIARRLLAGTAEKDLPDRIFEIANQFVRGQPLITSGTERLRVAKLYLLAGLRSRASAAYTSAIAYLQAGCALLPAEHWKQQYELSFGLKFCLAECHFLSYDFPETERLLVELLARAHSKVDKASAYKLKIGLHILNSQHVHAIDTAIECLALFGVRMSSHPERAELDQAYQDIRKKLDGRTIQSLEKLPRMEDPDVEAAMSVLATMYGPAIFTDETLSSLHLCHMVSLTLTHGVTGSSASGIATFGIVLGHVYGEYQEGYEFAKLARALVKRHNFLSNEAMTLWAMEIVSLWTNPVSEAIDAIRAAFRAGVEAGDLLIAGYACNHLITDLLIRGDRLDDISAEIEGSLAFAQRAGFRDVTDVIIGQQRFVMAMRGLTQQFGSFTGNNFEESDYERSLTADRATTMICWYWIIKGQARFLSGRYDEARSCFDLAAPLLWSSPGHIQLLDYHFYAALTAARSDPSTPGKSPSDFTASLIEHLTHLERWASSFPPTFADKHALVKAEMARLEGRSDDAALLYEQAIRLARTNGFLHIEAISYELAGYFYAARGLTEIAQLYLRNARERYARWGAEGKVLHLEESHPHLRAHDHLSASTNLIDTRVEQLDLATVMRVLQAVSAEMVLEKLLNTLMRIALEQAGAERGLLILCEAAEPRLAAEASVTSGEVAVIIGEKALASDALPHSVLRYVLRTHEGVILDNAAGNSPYSDDAYIQTKQARSLICLPLANQGKLIGAIYLENALTSGAFIPSRAAILRLLASQAAISLENSRLYRGLEQREAKIRRLVEANIIGIFFWDMNGRIIDANDEFLRIIRFQREDVVAGKLRWTDLTPPEWLERDQGLWVPELKRIGSALPYEKEFFRSDASRVPVLIGVAILEEDVEQGVAFVLDLSARKQAEEDARNADLRYREAHAELAHANRVATMGQLTASIAHEVRQPIAATSANAEAARRFLQRDPPNIQEVDDALTSIVADSNRASEIISRIHGIVKKTPPQNEQLEINSVIREVVELTRGETSKHGILVETQFQEQLPFLTGDKVQLQQVILNLIINAVDAMSSVNGHDRRLLISTEMAGLGGVVVTVSDTGPGLSETTLQQVFNAFYTTKPSGFGLGLSISRSIVEAHGGTLSARANEMGGATFQFSLAPHEVADEF